MELSLTDLIFQLFLRGLGISVMIHEYGHIMAARALGFYAEIRSVRLNAAYPEIRAHLGRGLLPHEHILFYGGGGWFTAVIFYLFCIRNKDPENKLINKWIAIENLVYGCFEAFAPRSFWELGGLIGILAALA